MLMVLFLVLGCPAVASGFYPKYRERYQGKYTIPNLLMNTPFRGIFIPVLSDDDLEDPVHFDPKSKAPHRHIIPIDDVHNKNRLQDALQASTFDDEHLNDDHKENCIHHGSNDHDVQDIHHAQDAAKAFELCVLRIIEEHKANRIHHGSNDHDVQDIHHAQDAAKAFEPCLRMVNEAHKAHGIHNGPNDHHFQKSNNYDEQQLPDVNDVVPQATGIPPAVADVSDSSADSIEEQMFELKTSSGGQ